MYCDKCGKRIEGDEQFCTHCGEKVEQIRGGINKTNEEPKEHKSKTGKGKYIIIGIIGLVLILGIILANSNNNNSDKTQTNTSTNQPQTTEIDNTAAVVNILCDTGYGGSGTILTKDGLIMTNNHVISGAKYCVVTVPNPKTGEIVEIYFAEPSTVPKLSKQYDIAVLEIYDTYTDDEGKTWGTFPPVLPYFQTPDSCVTNSQKLGDPIKIYGYPVTSQNYNLTVTEGIISNISSDSILTSAKIDSGNSGGLAMTNDGCMVGIPSAVLEGNYQNLGVIIPSDIIWEFFDKAIAQLTPSGIEITPSPQKKAEKPILKPTINTIPTTSTNETQAKENQIGTNNVKTPLCSNPVDKITLTSITNIGGGKVKITWNPIYKDKMTGYYVDYGLSSGSFPFDTAAGSSTFIEVGGLNPGTKYFFAIYAGWHTDASGFDCATSNEASIIVR